MTRPNILFIFADDQRHDTISSLGNPAIHTPNLDRLVSTGLTFSRAHIPSGTSGAVCMPSRAMLMTGRTLFHLQGCGEAIPPEHVTFPELLQRHGYSCYGSGKWHNGRESFARSFDDGAEIFFGGMADHWNVPAYDYDPTGAYDGALREIPDAFHSNEVRLRQCDHIHSGCHSTDVIMQAAVDYISNYESDNPFCMYVSLLAPHDPRSMPDEFLQMYNPAEIDLPPNYQPEHLIDTGALRNRDETLDSFPRDPERVRRHIAEYYGMISHIDFQLGRVVSALEESGQRDNTLIVYAGDNGLAVGQHGLLGKQNHYEHSIRVPLILSGPGVPSGATAETFAYLLDIFPTLCDYLQIRCPGSVEGRSFASVLSDPAIHIRDDLYFAFTDSIRSVKDQRFKLIEYATERQRASQLFDLQADPHEMSDRFGDPELRDVQERLTRLLMTYRDSWEDTEHPLSAGFWGRYGSG